eukprot:403370670
MRVQSQKDQEVELLPKDLREVKQIANNPHLLHLYENATTIFADWGMIRYDEGSKGWEMLCQMIQANKKNNKVWQLVDKINQVKEQYQNIIEQTVRHSEAMRNKYHSSKSGQNYGSQSYKPCEQTQNLIKNMQYEQQQKIEELKMMHIPNNLLLKLSKQKVSQHQDHSQEPVSNIGFSQAVKKQLRFEDQHQSKPIHDDPLNSDLIRMKRRDALNQTDKFKLNTDKHLPQAMKKINKLKVELDSFNNMYSGLQQNTQRLINLCKSNRGYSQRRNDSNQVDLKTYELSSDSNNQTNNLTMKPKVNQMANIIVKSKKNKRETKIVDVGQIFQSNKDHIQTLISLELEHLKQLQTEEQQFQESQIDEQDIIGGMSGTFHLQNQNMLEAKIYEETRIQKQQEVEDTKSSAFDLLENIHQKVQDLRQSSDFIHQSPGDFGGRSTRRNQQVTLGLSGRNYDQRVDHFTDALKQRARQSIESQLQSNFSFNGNGNKITPNESTLQQSISSLRFDDRNFLMSPKSVKSGYNNQNSQDKQSSRPNKKESNTEVIQEHESVESFQESTTRDHKRRQSMKKRFSITPKLNQNLRSPRQSVKQDFIDSILTDIKYQQTNNMNKTSSQLNDMFTNKPQNVEALKLTNRALFLKRIQKQLKRSSVLKDNNNLMKNTQTAFPSKRFSQPLANLNYSFESTTQKNSEQINSTQLSSRQSGQNENTPILRLLNFQKFHKENDNFLDKLCSGRALENSNDKHFSNHSNYVASVKSQNQYPQISKTQVNSPRNNQNKQSQNAFAKQYQTPVHTSGQAFLKYNQSINTIVIQDGLNQSDISNKDNHQIQKPKFQQRYKSNERQRPGAINNSLFMNENLLMNIQSGTTKFEQLNRLYNRVQTTNGIDQRGNFYKREIRNSSIESQKRQENTLQFSFDQSSNQVVVPKQKITWQSQNKSLQNKYQEQRNSYKNKKLSL